MRNRKNILSLVKVALIVFAFIFCAIYIYPNSPFGGKSFRKQLLTKTDHQELLEAGREILIEANIKYETINGKRVKKIHYIPKNIKIPKFIRKIMLKFMLLPNIVYIHNYGFLSIEAGNHATGHFGINIYPENFEEKYPNYNYGDKELLPGLWYFDDNYRYLVGFDKTIDFLVKTGKYP